MPVCRVRLRPSADSFYPEPDTTACNLTVPRHGDGFAFDLIPRRPNSAFMASIGAGAGVYSGIHASLSAKLVGDDGWVDLNSSADGITVSKKKGLDPAKPELMAYRATIKPVSGVTVAQMYRAIWAKENNVGVIPHLKTVKVFLKHAKTF